MTNNLTCETQVLACGWDRPRVERFERLTKIRRGRSAPHGEEITPFLTAYYLDTRIRLRYLRRHEHPAPQTAPERSRRRHGLDDHRDDAGAAARPWFAGPAGTPGVLPHGARVAPHGRGIPRPVHAFSAANSAPHRPGAQAGPKPEPALLRNATPCGTRSHAHPCCQTAELHGVLRIAAHPAPVLRHAGADCAAARPPQIRCRRPRGPNSE